MKLAIVFVLMLVCASLAQAPPVRPGRRRVPNDQRSISQTFKPSQAGEMDGFMEGFIGMILSELKNLHIDNYPVENGEFKNVDIRVNVPASGGITFRGDPNGDAMLLRLKNVKANIDTDMDLEHGSVKGSAVVDVNNMDIDLKTTPVSINGEDHVNIQFHLHIKDADVAADVNALDLESEMPEGFDMNSLLGGMNFRIGRNKPTGNTLENQTRGVLKNYYG